jgi:hypothetical protein
VGDTVLMRTLLSKSTACYGQNHKESQVEKKNHGFGLHTNHLSEQHYCLIILVFYTTISLTFQAKLFWLIVLRQCVEKIYVNQAGYLHCSVPAKSGTVMGLGRQVDQAVSWG